MPEDEKNTVAKAALDMRRARRKMLVAANTFRAEAAAAANAANLLRERCNHKKYHILCAHPERVAATYCDIAICPLFDAMDNQIQHDIEAFCLEMRGEL